MNENKPMSAFNLRAHNPTIETLRTHLQYEGDIVDFCVPVNTYFPPASLREQIIDKIDDLLKYYPAYAETHQEHLSKLTGIPPECIVAANGSTELISVLCRLAGDPVVTSIPTFGQWTDLPATFGKSAYYIRHEAEQGFKLEVDRVVREVRQTGAKTLVMCNPNNPTGVAFSYLEIVQLLHKLRDLDRIIIDESFIDYAGIQSASSLAVSSDNVVVVKSMGKALGWHGIRLGYAIGNARTADQLRKQVPFWNINGVAAFVLQNLKQYAGEFSASMSNMRDDRQYMYGRLSQIDSLHCFASHANFLLVELDRRVDGARLRDSLLENHGLMVRECSNKLGSTAQFLRLAVRPRHDADRLADAIEREITLVSPFPAEPVGG